MEKKFNCIMCPLGCELTVTKQGQKIAVSGNTCPRGNDYAISELTAPKRGFSTLVKYNGGVVPVKTNGQVPKEKIFECIHEIAKITLPQKPKFHQVIIKNICNTGVDIIACS